MEFYYGLAQTIGIHTLLGLSAYVILLTGQMSMAQAAFYAIGAYASGMLTVLWGWHIVPALFAGAGLGAVVAGRIDLLAGGAEDLEPARDQRGVKRQRHAGSPVCRSGAIRPPPGARVKRVGATGRGRARAFTWRSGRRWL